MNSSDYRPTKDTERPRTDGADDRTRTAVQQACDDELANKEWRARDQLANAEWHARADVVEMQARVEERFRKNRSRFRIEEWVKTRVHSPLANAMPFWPKTRVLVLMPWKWPIPPLALRRAHAPTARPTERTEALGLVTRKWYMQI